MIDREALAEAERLCSIPSEPKREPILPPLERYNAARKIRGLPALTHDQFVRRLELLEAWREATVDRDAMQAELMQMDYPERAGRVRPMPPGILAMVNRARGEE